VVLAGTAAASEPHVGHWSGHGIRFHVEHDGSHTRVIDIRWQDRTSFASDWVYHGEFSSCWSSSSWTVYSIRTCLDGKFSSPTEATGTVRSFFVASDGWGHTAQRNVAARTGRPRSSTPARQPRPRKPRAPGAVGKPVGRGAYAGAAQGNAHAAVLAAASDPRVRAALERVTAPRWAS
jgi:hypothetical protein